MCPILHYSFSQDLAWGTSQSCPDPAMGTWLLCWVTLCLLGAGESSENQVASVCVFNDYNCFPHSIVKFCVPRSHRGWSLSVPEHKVTKRGQNVTFRCDPISGYIGLYWYQQMPGQGPTFLVYFQNNDPLDTSEMPNNRFSAERTKSSYSTLSITPAEPEDSAVYLCASSATTVWHRHCLPAHKPTCVQPCSALFGHMQPPALKVNKLGSL